MANFVLIAEDNPSDQMITKAFVEKEGFVAICVNNGYEAIDVLDEFKFKLFIIDLQMPVLNGLELLKRIRNRRSLADVPAIVLSGRQDKTDILAAIKCGAKDYIVKPMTKPVFDEKIHPILNEGKDQWEDFYIDPEQQSDKASLSRAVRLTAINEFVATVKTDAAMDIGEEVIFSSEFTKAGGVKDLKGKVLSCDQTEKDVFTVKIEYVSLSVEDRVRLHNLFSESWVHTAETHRKNKVG